MTYAVQSRTYSGPTEAAAAWQFEVDAAEAAKNGWTPATQAWDGTNLTVTYRPQRQTNRSRPVPERARVSRPPTLGSYLKALGLALLVSIPTYLVFGTILSAAGVPLFGTVALVVGLVAGIAAGGNSQHIHGAKGWTIVSVATIAAVLAIIFILLLPLLMLVLSDLEPTQVSVGIR